MSWFFWSDQSVVRREVLRAIELHGPAAEAYLNYPLQDPATSRPRRRLARAALRYIRRMKKQGITEL